MARFLPVVLVVGLLGGSAAAFAVTERLKLERSPIFATRVGKVVSPASGRRVPIDFRVRKADDLSVAIVDGNDHVVRALVPSHHVRPGPQQLTWNGRDDSGSPLPDGIYRPRVHLAGEHRTILLPNPIVLDTAKPQVIDAHAVRGEFSPDGDHQADTVTLRYSLNKEAHVLVFLDGRRIIRGRSRKTTGKLEWGGLVDGRLLPPGTYVLTIGAVDVAGNRTPPAEDAHVRVQLRYIVLANRRITGVKAGKRFQIGVSTDAKAYRWTLGKRSGVAGGSVLMLRAPSKRGTYRLTVRERGHVDRALVVVR